MESSKEYEQRILRQISSQDRIPTVFGGIGFYLNINKTEFMCFKQNGAISTQKSKPLKYVNQFPYLDSESDVNICLVNIIAVDWLSIIGKSDLKK